MCFIISLVWTFNGCQLTQWSILTNPPHQKPPERVQKVRLIFLASAVLHLLLTSLYTALQAAVHVITGAVE